MILLGKLDNRGRGFFFAYTAILLLLVTQSLIKENTKFVSPILLAAIHNYFGLITTFLLFFNKYRFSTIKSAGRKIWIALFIAGFIGMGIGNFTRALALASSTLVNVIAIESTAPLAIYFLSILILGQIFKKRIIFFLLAASYGVVMISTHSPFFTIVPAFAIISET